MHEKRWPFVLLVVSVVGLGAVVVALGLDLRASKERLHGVEMALAALENNRAANEPLKAPPPGRIGNADLHVAPVALDPELSGRVAEIEKRLAMERGPEGLPAPKRSSPPLPSAAEPVPVGAPPTGPSDGALPADKTALKEMLRNLQKETEAEDEKKQLEQWQGKVIEGMAKSLELGPQQRDIVSQALMERFRDVQKLNELEQDDKLQDDEWEKQVYAVRKKADDQIRALLTADQLQKFDDWKKHQRWYGLQDKNG